MALTALIAIVAASYVRFAVAPFDNELSTAGIVPPLAEYLSELEAACPIVSLAVSALMTVFTGMIIGQTGGRFRLYSTQTFIAMPLFGLVACGIFIPCDTLSASLSALLASLTLKYLCRGYWRERDLSSMLYAGLSTGLLMLTSVAGVAYLLGAVLAIFILSFSTRELFVLIVAVMLAPALCCYAVWAMGGDFLAPLFRIWDSVSVEAGGEAFGCDAVCALTLCGLVMFVYVSSSALFLANRFMVAIKARAILSYNIVLSMLCVALFALPSATVSCLAVAAVPMSAIMPVFFIRERENLSAWIYVSLWIVFVLHLLYY